MVSESQIQQIIEKVMLNIQESLNEQPEPAEKEPAAPKPASSFNNLPGVVKSFAESMTANAVRQSAAPAAKPAAGPLPGIVKANRDMPSAPDAGPGIFATMEEAIRAAQIAYGELSKRTIKEREMYILAIKEMIRKEAEVFAKMGVEETGMGNFPDKVTKHLVVADLTPGTADLATETFAGDAGVTLIEYSPYGVIGAITPSTNPSETILCNTIGMLAAGNVVVFNPHPGANRTSQHAVRKINEAVVSAGGPANIAVTVAQPTLATSQQLFDHPQVKLLVGTGGPNLMQAMLKSGKKTICAGAGNPPVIVDETANLEKAARDILAGATLDNNLPCISEKAVIVVQDVADDLLYHFSKNGGYIAAKEEIRKLAELVLTAQKEQQAPGCVLPLHPREVGIKKEWVGKDVAKFLNALGVQDDGGIRCILCETDLDHPFVMEELMMPILPVVRVNSFTDAVEAAVKVEKGNRHSAHIHSNHIGRITEFARRIQTTVFVANGPSFASIGIEGEGFCTYTIAGPTGEGLTSARSFARKRRFVLSGGGLNVK
ncbi:MAG TPA: aldehyde dehydrogenase family protein [Bacilli bacterium]